MCTVGPINMVPRNITSTPSPKRRTYLRRGREGTADLARRSVRRRTSHLSPPTDRRTVRGIWSKHRSSTGRLPRTGFWRFRGGGGGGRGAGEGRPIAREDHALHDRQEVHFSPRLDARPAAKDLRSTSGRMFHLDTRTQGQKGKEMCSGKPTLN